MRPVTRMVVIPRLGERADRLDGERGQPLAAVEHEGEEGSVEVGRHHAGGAGEGIQEYGPLTADRLPVCPST